MRQQVRPESHISGNMAENELIDSFFLSLLCAFYVRVSQLHFMKILTFTRRSEFVGNLYSLVIRQRGEDMLRCNWLITMFWKFIGQINNLK